MTTTPDYASLIKRGEERGKRKQFLYAALNGAGAQDPDAMLILELAIALRTLLESNAALERERNEARSIVRDTFWMAIRYADGRKSYAVGMCNDAIRKAYDAGWLNYTREGHARDFDPQYARDGDKPEWCSIEARAEAAEAERDRLAERVKELEAKLARTSSEEDVYRAVRVLVNGGGDE